VSPIADTMPAIMTHMQSQPQLSAFLAGAEDFSGKAQKKPASGEKPALKWGCKTKSKPSVLSCLTPQQIHLLRRLPYSTSFKCLCWDHRWKKRSLSKRSRRQ